MDLDVEILECGRAAAPTQQYADFASLRNEQAGRVATDKAARAGHKHRLVRIDLHRVLFLSNDESPHRLLGWATELREDRSYRFGLFKTTVTFNIEAASEIGRATCRERVGQYV